VEFAVRFTSEPSAQIEFEHINTVDFPIEELDWLIACLQRIRAEQATAGVLGTPEASDETRNEGGA
jgi:hypothetical protein